MSDVVRSTWIVAVETLALTVECLGYRRMLLLLVLVQRGSLRPHPLSCAFVASHRFGSVLLIASARSAAHHLGCVLSLLLSSERINTISRRVVNESAHVVDRSRDALPAEVTVVRL
jgi:hypothetical protein